MSRISWNGSAKDGVAAKGANGNRPPDIGQANGAAHGRPIGQAAGPVMS